MTKKTVGYVELEWSCPNCGNRNPGSGNKCATCGFPQPENVKFEQGAQDVLLEDQAEIERAKRGPDIHCPFCGTRNLAGTERCKQCGGELAEGAARSAGRVVGALQTAEAPPLRCPACGSENPATNLKCTSCGASLVKPKPKPTQPAVQPPPGGSRIFMILAALVVVCIVAFVILSMRTKDLTAEVADVRWTRRVVVEALIPVTREGWLDQLPAGAEPGQCRQRLHHTQPDPEPGAVEVCGTPYTVDLGSGYGEVVQDCEYQVFQDWCTYTALAWTQFDSVAAQGSDFNPFWPATVLGENQREGGRQEEYVITFDTDGQDYTYTVRSLDDFRRFTPGSRWNLEVNSLGALVGVEPAE